MTKYASCSKIRADTRILNGAWQDIFRNKDIRLSAMDKLLGVSDQEMKGSAVPAGKFRGSSEDAILDAGGVCFEGRIVKKCEKNSRF